VSIVISKIDDGLGALKLISIEPTLNVDEVKVLKVKLINNGLLQTKTAVFSILGRSLPEQTV
jgi:hypothetical protein